MSKKTPIKGKVARILNSRELIINRGSDDGVMVDMKFAVLDPNAEDIVDPDTKEVLGSVYRPKVELEIARVEPRLSLARTFRTTRINVGGQGGGLDLSRLFMPPKYEYRYDSLKTTESTWEDLSEEDSYVKVGDPVEQIVNPAPE